MGQDHPDQSDHPDQPTQPDYSDHSDSDSDREIVFTILMAGQFSMRKIHFLSRNEKVPLSINRGDIPLWGRRLVWGQVTVPPLTRIQPQAFLWRRCFWRKRDCKSIHPRTGRGQVPCSSSRDGFLAEQSTARWLASPYNAVVHTIWPVIWQIATIQRSSN